MSSSNVYVHPYASFSSFILCIFLDAYTNAMGLPSKYCVVVCNQSLLVYLYEKFPSQSHLDKGYDAHAMGTSVQMFLTVCMKTLLH